MGIRESAGNLDNSKCSRVLDIPKALEYSGVPKILKYTGTN